MSTMLIPLQRSWESVPGVIKESVGAALYVKIPERVIGSQLLPEDVISNAKESDLLIEVVNPPRIVT